VTRQPDRRVADVLDRSNYVGFTWNDALRALDLAEYNARLGGRASWGRLRAQRVEAKGK
jgi:hypothetical protein